MLMTIAVGVFIGNVVTAAFLASFTRLARYKEDREIPGIVLAGIIMPMIFMILGIIAFGDLPQSHLAAFFQ